MSNKSQHSESPDFVPDESRRTSGEQHLEDALSSYRSRFSAGHDVSIRDIERAICEVVDEMKHEAGPVAVVLNIKRQLHAHPASVSMHESFVRCCIERYYK